MEREQSTSEQPDEPILRRETILVSRDRGRLSFLFVVCSLAGVAMGFGLRGAPQAHRCAAAHSPPPAQTSQLRCDQGCTWLGVQMAETPAGVRIVQIFPGTPAAELAQGGLLEPGDTIDFVAGERVHRASQVIRQIRSRSPGDVVSMRLRRPGQQVVVLLEAELGWISGQQLRSLR